MTQFVPFHVLFVTEALQTYVTRVRALAGVLAQVRLYQTERSERFVAVLALVRTIIFMHLHMSYESAFVVESHVASVAAKRSVRLVAL